MGYRCPYFCFCAFLGPFLGGQGFRACRVSVWGFSLRVNPGKLKHGFRMVYRWHFADSPMLCRKGTKIMMFQHSGTFWTLL